MHRKLLLIAALVAGAAAQDRPNDERAIRDLMARWNAAYRGLDAKALAALETPDVEIIDRFGHWYPSTGPADNERLWAVTFTEIYKGKPGPERAIERIRFLRPDVAIVQARAYHADGVTLDDGTRIAPFWEIDTYVVAKENGAWRVSAQSIHNQLAPEDAKPGERLDLAPKPAEGAVSR